MNAIKEVEMICKTVLGQGFWTDESSINVKHEKAGSNADVTADRGNNVNFFSFCFLSELDLLSKAGHLIGRRFSTRMSRNTESNPEASADKGKGMMLNNILNSTDHIFTFHKDKT